MKFRESELQISCINWFRYQYPKNILFSIPNGGHRKISTAKIMKAEGVLAGVPDLFLMEPKGEYHGMYIEMKAGKNGLTESQIKFFIEAEKRKFKCIVCKTYDELKKEIINYLK